MQTAKCPHCGKGIDVVSAKDLEAEYSISPNALQHARERDSFPPPWLEFANRNIWLKGDIDSYAAERTQERVQKRVEELTKLLDGVPEAERKRVLAELAGTT